MERLLEVPQAILIAVLNGEEKRINSCSCDELEIVSSFELLNLNSVKIVAFNLETYSYENILIEEFYIKKIEENEFAYRYLIKVYNNDLYVSTINKFLKMLNKVIDNYSNNLVNHLRENDIIANINYYPVKKDKEFSRTFIEQKEEWFKNLGYKTFDDKKILNIEFAFEIDNNKLYNDYLDMDLNIFIPKKLDEINLMNHPLFYTTFKRIYVGNQFCHNLFPDKNILLKILDKAYKENLEITIAFTYIREEYIYYTEEIISIIYNWCENNGKMVEIIVNDWGMIKLFTEKLDLLTPILGVLLNKRKKDPRMKWKWGVQNNIKRIVDNNLSCHEYREFLSKLHINRYEYETSTFLSKIHKTNSSLHFPYYQMNTSQYCPLYAQCKNYSRNRQILVKSCPKYCSEFVFMYPKHLNMVGKYNSIFGFDDAIFNDFDILKYYIDNGIDRLVMNFT